MLVIYKQDYTNYHVTLYDLVTYSMGLGIRVKDTNILLEALIKLRATIDVLESRWGYGPDLNNDEFLYAHLGWLLQKNRELTKLLHKERKHLTLDWCYAKGMPEAAAIKNIRYLRARVKALEGWLEHIEDRCIHPQVFIDHVNALRYSKPALLQFNREILRDVVIPREGDATYRIDISSQESLIYGYMYGTDTFRERIEPADFEQDYDFYDELLWYAYGRENPELHSFAGGVSNEAKKFWRAERDEIKSNWISIMRGTQAHRLKSDFQDASILYDFFCNSLQLDKFEELVSNELTTTMGKVYTYVGSLILPQSEDYKGKSRMELIPETKRTIKELNFIKRFMTNKQYEEYDFFDKPQREKLVASVMADIDAGEFGADARQKLDELITNRPLVPVRLSKTDLIRILYSRVRGTAADVLALLACEIAQYKEFRIYFTLADELYVNVPLEVEASYGVVGIEKILKGLASHEIKGLGKFQVKVSRLEG